MMRTHRLLFVCAKASALLLAVILGTKVGWTQTTATWENNANGQVFDCNGADPGGVYSWPDNNLWSQEELIGNDPCGNPAVLQPSNWSTALYPDNGRGGTNYDVVIGAPTPTTLNVSPTIDTLDVTALGILDIQGGRTLTIAAGLLDNDGTITVNETNTSISTALNFSSSGSLTGTGEIVLNRNGTSATFDSDPGVGVTQASGHTIRGAGMLRALLTNNGVVESDAVAGGSLLILSDQDKTNNNIFRAVNGSTLQVSGITVTQDLALGQIIANGGDVSFTNSAKIVNGRLDTVGLNVIGQTGNTTLESVISNGTYQQNGGGTLSIDGTGLTNNGTLTVNFNNVATTTVMEFLTSGNLDGSGTLVLNRAGSAAVLRTSPGATIAHAAAHTIQGTGRIEAALVNDGVIEATPVAGGSYLDLRTEAKTNNNIMRATAGTTLGINGITLTQNPATGQVIADDGLVEIIAGANVIAGQLISLGGGAFQTAGSATLTGVTNQGTYNLLGGGALTIAGSGLTNNGTLTVNSNNTSTGTVLEFANSGMLTGSGTLVLNRSATAATLSTAAGATITHGAAHTIQGTGYINASLVNEGVIESTVRPGGSTLQLRINDKTNNSLLRANAGTELYVDGITLTQDNALGRIVADAGNVRIAGGANVVNGALETPSGGTVFTQGTATLTDVTSQGTYNLIGGSTLSIAGAGLTNNGTLTVNSNGTTVGTVLDFANGTTLDGTGVVVLNRNNSLAQLNTSGGGTVTQTATHTIRGSGQIHAGLVNNGLVEADAASSAGNLLQLLTANQTNNHILRANTGSELEISGIMLTQNAATGRIVADAGNVRIAGGANVVNGVLESPNSGTVFTQGTATLTDVTSQGTYNLIGGGTLSIAGAGLTNNGTLTVNSNGTTVGTVLDFANGTTLDGTGVVVLNRNNTLAQLNTSGGGTVTQTATHTIRGSGQIHAGLVNNGLVEADAASSAGNLLQLLTANKTNNHILRANASSELEISGITLTQNAATGRIIANEGDVELRAGTNVLNGTLETVGAGTVFTSTTATLTDVTSQGTYNLVGGSTLSIAGAGLTNNGTLTVNSNGTTVGTVLDFANGTTLDGTGVIVLNRTGSLAQLNATGGGTVTQTANHTIRGVGQVNADVINLGRMEGNSGASLLEVNGTVSGTGVLKDVRIDGGHAPGVGVGTAPLEGVYQLASSGSLLIEAGGLTAGTEHDQLVSSGTIALSGKLGVELVDAGSGLFAPSIGQMITILTATGGVSGTFANDGSIMSLSNSMLYHWSASYNANDVTLTVDSIAAVPLPGDYNDDHVVDAADYAVWRHTLGQMISLPNEGETLGKVTAEDYDVWRANFGASLGLAAANVASVPEPATTMLLLTALVAGIASTRFHMSRSEKETS